MGYISVTPEIALEEFPWGYAGGLGILEGDKLKAAGRSGVDYTAITLLYRNGYAEYEQIPAPNGVAYKPKEATRQPIEGTMIPEAELTVDLGSYGKEVKVRPWRLEIGSAKVIYLEPISPERIVKTSQKLYSEDSDEDKRVKYSILAKAAAAYITERISTDSIKNIDLQEAFSGLCVLTLPENLLQKTRLVIHTSGEWGHPYFPASFLENVFGYKSKSNEEWIMLTKLALERVSEAFAVSEKHCEIVRNTGCFEPYRHKIGYVTNGVDLVRWTHPEMAKLLLWKKSCEITNEEYSKAHQSPRADLIRLMRHYKPDLSIGSDTMIVSSGRRIDRYKRPHLVERLINDVAKDQDIIFVLAGKAHPKNGYGIEFMTKFQALSDKYKNVVYIPDYDIDKAKAMVSGSDLLLFTPFSGVESSGTSQLKAGVNGVPTLSARDGASLEVIIHGQNGWFFGNDLRYCTDLDKPDGMTWWIDEVDYRCMKEAFLGIVKLKKENPDRYTGVMVDTMRSFREKMDIMRTLKDYGILASTDRTIDSTLPGLRRDAESAASQKLRST